MKTRGAGGGDTLDNLAPLCRVHHSLWHAKGAAFMLNRFPGVYRWCVEMGRQDVIDRATRFAQG